MSALDTPTIYGTFPLTANVSASYTSTDNSVIRMQFKRSTDSLTSFVSAKFCIVTANDVKVLAGVFAKEDGSTITLIQIPLLGQSIKDLVNTLNSYSDIVAEPVNSAGFIASDLLEDTAFIDASGKWVYFEASKVIRNNVYSTLNIDLKYMLTSTEPLMAQRNLTQSLGGYVSLSEVYRNVRLANPLSIYDNTIYIDQSSLSSTFTIKDLQKMEYLQIQDEIVKISKWLDYTAYLSERNVYNTPLRFHPKNSVIREISKNSFFDGALGTDLKQYRCIAIKNTNPTETAKNLKVFFKFPSRNNLSGLKIAIEAPTSDYYSGAVTSGGITAFAVADLVGKFTTDHYALAPISFTSGLNTAQSRVIKSYNPTSGTLVLDNRLPNPISEGDEFFIDTAPSQRVKSGTKAPSAPCSSFYDATNEENALSINVQGNRSSGTDLLPNEVVYVWVERSIAESNDEFLNNRTSLSLIYSRV